MSRINKTRQRRINRSRGRAKELNTVYMSVHRTPNHVYAQIFSPRGEEVLVCASSVEADIKKGKKETGKIVIAEAVGKLIAERAKAKGITQVAFDRSGYKYHGRVKALAEAARANGLAC